MRARSRKAAKVPTLRDTTSEENRPFVATRPEWRVVSQRPPRSLVTKRVRSVDAVTACAVPADVVSRDTIATRSSGIGVVP